MSNARNIIPPEQFDRVQEIIERGILLSYRRPSKPEHFRKREVGHKEAV